jgi:hypothetical protein
MAKIVRSILAGVFGFSLMACGGPGDSITLSESETSSIRLELTSQTQSGNVYRLGPATFDINGFGPDGPVSLSVDASGDESLLQVLVEPGSYDVGLREGWVLQHLDVDGNPTPIAATLTSPPVQYVSVEPFQAASLVFSFHLGQASINIGIDVDEGVPPGYDAMISPVGDGRYMITFAGGGGACCWDSVEEALLAYPDMNMFVSEP